MASKMNRRIKRKKRGSLDPDLTATAHKRQKPAQGALLWDIERLSPITVHHPSLDTLGHWALLKAWEETFRLAYHAGQEQEARAYGLEPPITTDTAALYTDWLQRIAVTQISEEKIKDIFDAADPREARKKSDDLMDSLSQALKKILDSAIARRWGFPSFRGRSFETKRDAKLLELKKLKKLKNTSSHSKVAKALNIPRPTEQSAYQRRTKEHEDIRKRYEVLKREMKDKYKVILVEENP